MDELKNVLSKSVPFLGSVIGTASPVAGVLFNSIASLFGLDSNASPEDLRKAIEGDKEAYLKLRTLEMTHASEIQQAELQMRLGAYNREIEVVKATGRHDWVLSALALSMIAGFFIYAFMLFFVHVDSTVHDIVMFIAGQISSMAILVASYFFGATVHRGKMPEIHTAFAPSTPDVILPPPAKTR